MVLEKLTAIGKLVLLKSHDRAVELGSDKLGVEHLYLGLIEVEKNSDSILMSIVKAICDDRQTHANSVAYRLLRSKGITVDIVREEIIKINNSKSISSLNQVIRRILRFLIPLPIPFTPQISQVIYESIKIAAELGDNFVCSEHLLLSLFSINDERNLKIIKNLGINSNELKQQTILAIQSRQGSRS